MSVFGFMFQFDNNERDFFEELMMINKGPSPDSHLRFHIITWDLGYRQNMLIYGLKAVLVSYDQLSS